jgi:hypothetical protein
MKTKLTCLAMVLAAFQTGVSAQQVTPDLSTLNAGREKTKIQILVPMNRWPTEPSSRITRAGNLSSRPWTEIVGWHPNDQPSFMDAIHGEPKFDVVSIGIRPGK